MKNTLFVIVLFGFVTISLFAHPGRTDRNGGHNGPNGYHYHNGGGSSGGSTQRTTVTPSTVSQDVTTVIYEGNNFEEALNSFLLTCDSLECDLPYFQSLGIGDENTIRRNSRYYVYKTVRSNNTLVRFNDLNRQKRVTLIFARNSNSFNGNSRVFQYPNVRSRESANNFVIEMNN